MLQQRGIAAERADRGTLVAIQRDGAAAEHGAAGRCPTGGKHRILHFFPEERAAAGGERLAAARHGRGIVGREDDDRQRRRGRRVGMIGPRQRAFHEGDRTAVALQLRREQPFNLYASTGAARGGRALPMRACRRRSTLSRARAAGSRRACRAGAARG